jgi:hypothetical protein
MESDIAYNLFSGQLMRHEALTIRQGKGGLSYYKNGVFVCHFNARPQRQRDDLGFVDFRYDSLRPYIDVEEAISALQRDAAADVQLKRHKLWCALHFPLEGIEHVANLFVRHIISKVHT